jgi:hypothetical protein
MLSEIVDAAVEHTEKTFGAVADASGEWLETTGIDHETPRLAAVVVLASFDERKATAAEIQVGTTTTKAGNLRTDGVMVVCAGHYATAQEPLLFRKSPLAVRGMQIASEIMQQVASFQEKGFRFGGAGLITNRKSETLLRCSQLYVASTFVAQLVGSEDIGYT